MSRSEDRRISTERLTAIAAIIVAVLGVVSSPAWGPPLCKAIGVCESVPGQAPLTDLGATATSSPAPAATTGQPPQSPAPATLDSVNRAAPGCSERDSRVAWTTVKGGVSCSSAGMTLAKKVGWDEGFLQSFAEQRMSLKGRQLPGSFTVSFTIGGLSAPDTDRNRGGCGGLAVHTSQDSRTFDYFNVCADGWVETVRVVGNAGVDNQTRQLTPGPVSGSSAAYTAVVTVSPSAMQVTVSNRVGQSVTISSPAVGGTSAYISLMTTWRNVGATATFSDFTYSAG